jgi:hypothetical protein
MHIHTYTHTHTQIVCMLNILNNIKLGSPCQTSSRPAHQKDGADPILHSASIVLQNAYRLFKARRKLESKISGLDGPRRSHALSARSSRSSVLKKRAKTPHTAAVQIQAAVRGHFSRQETRVVLYMSAQLSAAVALQQAWRACACRKAVRLLRNEEGRRRHVAAKMLQLAWLARLSRHRVALRMSIRYVLCVCVCVCVCVCL